MPPPPAAAATNPGAVLSTSVAAVATATVAAGHPIALVSFPSTGDFSRDRTIAALYQALSAALVPSGLSSLDLALSSERQVHEWSSSLPVDDSTGSAETGPLLLEAPAAAVAAAVGLGQQGGMRPTPYLSRSFLLWSLLAPDSESFSEDLRALVLGGQVTPKALANLDLEGGAQGGV